MTSRMIHPSSPSDERKPVDAVSELRTLDERDMLHGYLAGLNGREEPGCEFNRDYWHGWRNGMVDSGRMRKDSAQGALAKDAISSGYLAQHFGDVS